MKKIVAVMIVLAMALSLIGCGEERAIHTSSDPVPTATPTPTPAVVRALPDETDAEPYFTYSGSGDDVVTGLQVDDYSCLKIYHMEDGYFSVRAYYDLSTGDYDQLVSTSAAYSGGSTLLLPKRIYTIEVMARGDWTLEAYRIGTCSYDMFSGYGDCVTPLFAASSHTYEIESDDYGDLTIKGYYGRGEYEVLLETTEPYSGKVLFPHQGEHCFFTIEGDRSFNITPVSE